MRTRILLAGLAAAGLTAAAACGHTTRTGAGRSPAGPAMSGMTMSGSAGSMPGMDLPAGNGLAATARGYTLTLAKVPMAGMAMPLTFSIGRDRKPVTRFDPEQTKLMHFYLIRTDLTGFQHLHPTMNAAGTWSVTPHALTPGKYRVYTQFLPRAGAGSGAVVVSRSLTIDGRTAPATELPSPSAKTTVDGYTLRLTGRPKAGTDSPLQIRVGRAGRPVRDLQPYLDTYAHVTAIRAGDLAFAHLHPAGPVHGNHGGPTLTVQADLPAAGHYRMFIQFRARNRLHTAAITLSAS